MLTLQGKTVLLVNNLNLKLSLRYDATEHLKIRQEKKVYHEASVKCSIFGRKNFPERFNFFH